MRPRRRPRRFRSTALIPVIVLLAAAIGFGLTAANVVASSRASLRTAAVTVDQFSPSSCSALALATIVTGGVNGNAQANLVLGTAAADTMNGAGANDCVVGGGGNDALTGGAGTDVCIGGPGTDTFAANCETQIQ